MRTLLIAFLSVGCFGNAAPSQGNTPASIEHAAGTVVRLDAKGFASHVAASSNKARVYNVWATWCGPCVQEMPILRAFGEANPEIELWFVNVDHAGMPEQKIARHLKEYGISAFHHIRPIRGEYDLTSQVDLPDVVPVTVVIGTDGSRVRTFMGRVHASDLAEVAAQVR